MSLQQVLSVRAPVPIGDETASVLVGGEAGSAPRPVVAASAPSARTAAPDAGDPALALLDGLAAQAARHVLVLGHGALELMCALIRGGSHEVTELRAGDRPEATTADLVLVPQVRSADQAVMLVGHARRALVPTGRVVLGVSGKLATGLVRILRLHGFSAICRRDRVSGSVVSAVLPAFPRPEVVGAAVSGSALTTSAIPRPAFPGSGRSTSAFQASVCQSAVLPSADPTAAFSTLALPAAASPTSTLRTTARG
jgi:hypothetical protein